MKNRLAYYITAHGYGHGVRSCDVLRAFHALRPNVDVLIVTDLPDEFLRNRMPNFNYKRVARSLDIGMVQLDSIRMDVDRTLGLALDLCDQHDEFCNREQEFLRKEEVGLAVCDIPGIPIAAAAAAGIPRYAIGNFSWSWIYEEFVPVDPRWQTVVDCFAADYAQTDLLLRLPFAEPMSVFPVQQEVGLLATPGTTRREALAELTGAPLDLPWVLLSFSTLEWDDAAVANLTAMQEYAFFTVKPLEWEGANLFAVDRSQISFSDVLASIDVVVTKPGFGVVSECVANRKPMIYADREDFREYPVLETAIQRYLQYQHLPTQQLYQGDLRGALEAIWRCPEPSETLPGGGADQVAALLSAAF